MELSKAGFIVNSLHYVYRQTSCELRELGVILRNLNKLLCYYIWTLYYIWTSRIIWTFWIEIYSDNHLNTFSISYCCFGCFVFCYVNYVCHMCTCTIVCVFAYNSTCALSYTEDMLFNDEITG